MSRRRLPSLTALRAFESVAQHRSLARAAQELFVTQSAVGHQLRKLEQELGFPLVVRQGGKLDLTPQGKSLSATLREAFDTIQQGTATLDGSPIVGEVTIAAPPALSAWRLVLMLGDFLEQHPEVSLKLLPIEKADSTTDLVISFGEPPVAGERTRILNKLTYFPVCSPRLLKGQPSLGLPSQLRHHVLLHEDDGTDWRRWFAAAKSPVAARQHVFFPNSYLTLQAAQRGFGLAIGDDLLASEELRKGTLIRPFDVVIPALQPYYLITPSGGGKSVGRELRDWILKSFSQDAPLP